MYVNSQKKKKKSQQLLDVCLFQQVEGFSCLAK